MRYRFEELQQLKTKAYLKPFSPKPLLAPPTASLQQECSAGARNTGSPACRLPAAQQKTSIVTLLLPPQPLPCAPEHLLGFATGG